VNEILQHFQSLPRAQLQSELRRITGMDKLYLWEYVAYNWMYVPVHAGPETAAKTGVKLGDVVGYHVVAGHVMGGAFGDLMNAEPQNDPPHPDPFKRMP
jgi:hypothetical protein